MSAEALSMAPHRQGSLTLAGFIRETHLLSSCSVFQQSVTRDYYKTLNGDFGYYMNLYVQDSYRMSDRLTLTWDFGWSAIRFTRVSTAAKQPLTWTTRKLSSLRILITTHNY